MKGRIKIKVLIYGAGAVGLGLGSFLLKSGVKVDFIARKNTAEALNKNGLVRSGIFGEVKFSSGGFGIYTSLETLKHKKYDFILVCVKSFDSDTSAKGLSGNEDILNPDTKIVLCQNGWGNAEIFLEHFTKKQICNARVITGFSRPEPNHVEITVHAEPIRLGNLWEPEFEGLEPLGTSISNGGIPCEITGSIGRDLWAKMLYNCALNPLGALLDVTYGELAEHEMSRGIMENIIAEIFKVMDGAGFKTYWEEPRDYLKDFYRHLVPSTAGHRSSTLQSLKAHKKTELDFLNGAVIRLAGELGIPVPVNSTVLNMVKFIEEVS